MICSPGKQQHMVLSIVFSAPWDVRSRLLRSESLDCSIFEPNIVSRVYVHALERMPSVLCHV